MVRSNYPDVTFALTDNIAGIDVSSIELRVYGEAFHVAPGVLELVAAPDSLSGNLYFHTLGTSLVFPAGDTVWMELSLSDSPDYCVGNAATFAYYFWVEPDVGCHVVPNPMTPNGDGVNDAASVAYPGMFSEGAVLKIFNLRNVEVYSADIEPVSSYAEVSGRMWDGRTNSGELCLPGIYLYVIVQDGEVICNGTITLVR